MIRLVLAFVTGFLLCTSAFSADLNRSTASLWIAEIYCGRSMTDCNPKDLVTICKDAALAALSRAQVYASQEKPFYTEMLQLNPRISYRGHRTCSPWKWGQKQECDTEYTQLCTLEATVTSEAFKIQYSEWTKDGNYETCAPAIDARYNDASILSLNIHERESRHRFSKPSRCWGEQIQLVPLK